MDVLKLGEPNNFWNAPSYSVKVRGTRYLWGSAGLTTNLTFGKPFVLHIANDQAGEPVTIGIRVAAGNETDLGTIAPGECLSVPVEDICGVYAECTTDSLVHCLIY
ncbi:hypothetical protein [Mitsuaria sp. BK037]|uniref:hypothetical protein n=1 Tax=Mitsuaria sp. BK037 TaxID=2587122 RepID=UPI00161FE113|nr:hypothetical protein [Mitsuaria sp. BK037]MBB3282771.1 hypothetical protein [Mitsuaria sp. BK037]